MAFNTQGTVIPARLASDDEFAYLEDTDIIGGFRVVATITDRNNIMATKRKAGMQVYVLETKIKYELASDLVTWVPISDDSDLTYLAFLQSQNTTLPKPVISVDNKPLYCFSINNNTSIQARQLVACLYLDGLFNANYDVALKGNKAVMPIDPKVSGLVPINLISNTYQVPTTLSVNNLVTNIANITTKAKLMMIGHSQIANNLVDNIDNNKGFTNIGSKIILDSLKDNIDSSAIPSILGVGHANFITKSETYKGNSLGVRFGSAAQSGWAACHYLNHAIRLTSLTDVSSPNTNIIAVQQLFVSANISYYLLGLKTSTGNDYTGSVSQQELIRTTVQGKNPCDKVQALYDWMKVRPEWITLGFPNDAYTNTGTQNTNMDTFNNYIMDNPGNPFFSREKVQSTSPVYTNAFSLTKYLSRYKTMDDAGLRLVQGSTAGTEIGRNGNGITVNSFDVSTPTHITITFGENDYWLFENATPANHATIIKSIADAIIADFPNMKIGIFILPRPGSKFADLFSVGIRKEKSDPKYYMPNLRAALISLLGVTQTNPKQNNIYYIDTYMFAYPNSHQYDQFGESGGVPIDYEESAISTVHQGLRTSASVAEQLKAWVAYSMFN